MVIMQPVVIPLSSPATLFENEKPVTSVTLKVPTGGMYLELGEPRYLAQTNNGTAFWFEDKDAIRRYIDRCIDHPHGARLASAMSLEDVRAVRQALFGFFIDTKPTTSDS